MLFNEIKMKRNTYIHIPVDTILLIKNPEINTGRETTWEKLVRILVALFIIGRYWDSLDL